MPVLPGRKMLLLELRLGLTVKVIEKSELKSVGSPTESGWGYRIPMN
jgi:hypothetical protein